MSRRPFFLETRVARRILLLFVLSALLPITVLAVVSYVQVVGELRRQGEERLAGESKAYGMGVLQRLALADRELRGIAATVAGGSGGDPGSLRTLAPALATRFRGIARSPGPGAGGEAESLLGDVSVPTGIDPSRRTNLGEEGALLVVLRDPARGPRILLARSVGPGGAEAPVLWGELDPGYLWELEADGSNLPRSTDLCVLDGDRRPLACTLPDPRPAAAALAGTGTPSGTGTFRWTAGAGDQLAGYWHVFLRGEYGAPSWVILFSRPESAVLAPVSDFTRTFPVVVLLALWIVLLMANVQIRRSLVPLQKLKDAIQRIGHRDFKTTVVVESDDEFEELAEAFNRMTTRIDRQFRTLTTMDEIDRAVLSSLDRETIVRTVLDRIREVVPCDAVSVTLLDRDASPPGGRVFVREWRAREGGGAIPAIRTVELDDDELRTLKENREHFHREIAGGGGEAPLPSYAPVPDPPDTRGALEIFPVFLGSEPVGAITLRIDGDGSRLPEVDRVQVGQLADQVAVAFSNARLVEELDELSWGALTAFARAIDVKSRWTSGHSERVARLSLSVGRELGLELEELELLQRGALLHDIGKIGVPVSILDKPGALTEEEARIMRSHVEVGAAILEPIPQYADVIPIVKHHHERVDGRGYPNGLAGDAIHLHARIVGVADCYDALTSDRPYRPGLTREETLAFVQDGAGTRFDPGVVRALLDALALGEEARGRRMSPVVRWPDLAPASRKAREAHRSGAEESGGAR